MQRRAEFDDALDLARTGISLRVRDTRGHDDGLARSGYALFAAHGEVGFTRQDGESLFLAGMDVDSAYWPRMNLCTGLPQKGSGRSRGRGWG